MLSEAVTPREKQTGSAIPIEHDPLKPNFNYTNSVEAWTMFKQCDAQWGSQNLGTCALTICQAGCAMTSVAMILATRGVQTNPSILNSWLNNNSGYADGCDIYWGIVDDFGKTSYQGMETASYSTVCAGVAAGHGVVANVRDGTHWVLITGCSSPNLYNVNDPGFNQATYPSDQVSQEAVYH